MGLERVGEPGRDLSDLAEQAVDLGVDAGMGRETVELGPAVVVDGGMQRLTEVLGVMGELGGVEQAARLE